MVQKSRAASAVRSSVTVPMSIMRYKTVEKVSSHRDQVKLCCFKPCGFQAFEALERTKGASSLAGIGCGDLPLQSGTTKTGLSSNDIAFFIVPTINMASR